MLETYITAYELIEAMRIANIPVTRAQLIRWQNRGAIPRPVQRSLGKGGGRGTVTLYPISTLEQIKALYGYLQDKRSLDQAIINLWMDGYSTDLRGMARIYLQGYTREVEGLRNEKYGDYYLNKRARKKIGEYSDYKKKKRLPPMLSYARGHLKKGGFEKFMFMVLTITANITEIWEVDEISALVKSTGMVIDHSLNDDIKRGKIENDLGRLSGYLTPENLVSVLENTSDDLLRLTYRFLMDIINALRYEIPVLRKTEPFQNWDAESQILITIGFLAYHDLIMPLLERLALIPEYKAEV